MNSAMKMPWMILIMAFPVAGVGIYLLCGHSGVNIGIRKHFQALQSELTPLLPDKEDVLQKLSDEDKALMYGIAGGTPQYLLQMNDNLSVEDNIKNTFLNPMSFLYEEPVNLLKQEVREPAIYTAIITAIATGHSRMSEISTKVGENTNVCSRYLKNLINLGIIKRETPYGEKDSKKSIYSIEDNMFNFWYRFVVDNNSIIVRGATDLVYKKIEKQLSDYMGRVFEDICTQYLWKQLLAGNSPIEFVSLGRWWGNDSVNKCQTEIVRSSGGGYRFRKN